MTIEGIASGVGMCEGQAEGARTLAAAQAQQARRLAVKQALLEACGSGLRSQRLEEAPHLDAKAVARHAPAVARGLCAAWPCCAPTGTHRWTDARLLEWCAGTPLRVRVIAPQDAQGEGGAASAGGNETIFGDPTSAATRGDVYEWAELPVGEALARLGAGTAYAARVPLRELPALACRVPPATEAAPFVWAFGPPIDSLATMYLSGRRACTPCHWDPHEGLMLVLEGTKRVSLWAPTAGVIEQLGASPGGAFRYTAVARPKGPPPDYVIDVRAGDALYLPACWFHFVESAVGEDDAGRCLSVHYWYKPATCKVDPKLVQQQEPSSAPLSSSPMKKKGKKWAKAQAKKAKKLAHS